MEMIYLAVSLQHWEDSFCMELASSTSYFYIGLSGELKHSCITKTALFFVRA